MQTSDQALWFTTPPQRAVIIGAGAIGMEFASMWRPMGSEVTVVEALDRVLPLEDADCSAAVAKAYGQRGIEVLTSARVQSVERDGDTARVVVEVEGEERTLEADRVLVATGRGAEHRRPRRGRPRHPRRAWVRRHRRVGRHQGRRGVGGR